MGAGKRIGNVGASQQRDNVGVAERGQNIPTRAGRSESGPRATLDCSYSTHNLFESARRQLSHALTAA
eukprot:156991-Chlamydomonas_euryale.AAC.1